ncbi:MAG: hypothetical protein V4801_10265 [Burkholderia gladioli]
MTNEKAPHSAGKTGALDKEAVRTSADKEPADTIAANGDRGNAADGHVLTDEQREAVEYAADVLEENAGEVTRRCKALRALLTAPSAAASLPITGLLYEHDDGRWAVAADAESAHFARDVPEWHRQGPVEIHMPLPRAAAVPVGWKLVPVEPTAEQRRVAFPWTDAPSGVYRAMLDAAPAAPVAEPMPYFSGVSELIIRDVCEMEPANPDFSDTICIDVSDLQAIVKRHTESQPISGVAAIREVIHELRTYHPPGDRYNGKHIHPGWARRLENALDATDGAAQDDIEGIARAAGCTHVDLIGDRAKAIERLTAFAVRARAAVSPATADDRAAFEAWAATCNGNCDANDLLKKPDGEYFNHLVQRDWEVWQARASQAAAPALAREPAYLEAMLAAIDEFELVGDNNLARDLSAEEKFAVSEFVIGFFENRSVTPADAGEAVARIAHLQAVADEYNELIRHMDGGGDFAEFMAARTGAQGSGGGAA